jgi:hypothetical protein
MAPLLPALGELSPSAGKSCRVEVMAVHVGWVEDPKIAQGYEVFAQTAPDVGKCMFTGRDASIFPYQ